MDVELNARDVLHVAENVEQREIDFYVRASIHLRDPALKALCGRLSRWSFRHRKIWQQMRDKMGPSVVSGDNVFSHPGAMAGLTWFGLRRSSDRRAQAWTCPETLLWEARQRVNDLITFYRGLKGFAQAGDGWVMLDRIIKQETRHFDYIERLLRLTAASEKHKSESVG